MHTRLPSPIEPCSIIKGSNWLESVDTSVFYSSVRLDPLCFFMACRAIVKAKLEPYLGFLHSEQFGKPSLLCDLTELYRYFIDDFLIQLSQKLKKRDFITKTENYSSKRKGKREYLNHQKTRELMKKLNKLWEERVQVERVEGHGKRTTVETWINEEATLLAQYLRDEKPAWKPRIAVL